MSRRNEVASSSSGSLRFRSLGGWGRRPGDLQPELEGRIRAGVIGVEADISPTFLFAYKQRGGTALSPGEYLEELRRSAFRAGVSGTESFAALLPRRVGHQLQGRSRQRKCTSAYTPRSGLRHNEVASMRFSAIEAQPLSPEQLAAFGWRVREGNHHAAPDFN